MQGTEYIDDGIRGAIVYIGGTRSQSAVVQCTTGSRLWLESRDDKCAIQTSAGFKETTFGAFRI